MCIAQDPQRFDSLSQPEHDIGPFVFLGFLPLRQSCAPLTPCHLAANVLSLSWNATNTQERETKVPETGINKPNSPRLSSLALFLGKRWGEGGWKPWGGFIHPIYTRSRAWAFHLTDGQHPDLNYNQVIQWGEGRLFTDGPFHLHKCAHHLWKITPPPPLGVTYAFSSLYLGMHSAPITGWQGNRRLEKEKRENDSRVLLRRICFFLFIPPPINPAARSRC